VCHRDSTCEKIRRLLAGVTVRARPVGPDGCGPVTATVTGNRDNKEIRTVTMSGPMSERAPDITVEADGRTESTTVLVAKVSQSTLPRRGTRACGRPRSWAGSCSTGGRTMAGSAAPSPRAVSARAARSRTWWRTRARRQRCAARRTRCSESPTPPPTVPGGCCSLRRPPPASWPGLGPADPDPNYQFGRWLVTVWARPVGPDAGGCCPVTATGNLNRDYKEICIMSRPMSKRAPDITVEADGRAESTNVLAWNPRAFSSDTPVAAALPPLLCKTTCQTVAKDRTVLICL
jgi:hypothetical protein